MPLSTARGTRHFRTKEDQTKTSSFNLKCHFGILRNLPGRKTDANSSDNKQKRKVSRKVGVGLTLKNGLGGSGGGAGTGGHFTFSGHLSFPWKG